MEFDRKKQRAPTAGAASDTHTPGRRSLTQDLAPIRRQAPPPDAELITSDPAAGRPEAALQMRAAGVAPADDPAQVHAAAARGTASPQTRLPYLAQIQRAFGGHDVSGVKAHVGPDAAASARDMGAVAYATGDHVVLGDAADLHTVAHEAAHVVQQRGGVQLKRGVGEVGDGYERQADAVADAVVRGDSAEHLLGPARPGVASHQPHAVQRSGDGQNMSGLEEAEPADRRGAKRSQGNAPEQIPKRRSTRRTATQDDTGDEPSSVLDRVLAATGRSVSGTKQPIMLLGGAAHVFVPAQPQILFHGTSASFDRLRPGQVYISDYATALRNGHIKMAIEIVQPLRLLDLSDRTTVETLLRSPGAAQIHADLTATTGLSLEGDEIRGSFRKGTVGASDDAMCAWTQAAGCDGFARLPVDGKGFPELAVHAVEKLRVIGHINQRDRFTEVAGDSA